MSRLCVESCSKWNLGINTNAFISRSFDVVGVCYSIDITKLLDKLSILLGNTTSTEPILAD